MKPALRIIDARKTPKANLYPGAVARRPFELHSQTGKSGRFLCIPGATYETYELAQAAKTNWGLTLPL